MYNSLGGIMETNLEIEYKTMISKEAFQKLRREVFKSSAIKQVNTYYDTSDHTLLNKHIMMRIRRIDDKIDEFTIKVQDNPGVMEYSFSESHIDIHHPKIEAFFTQHQLKGPFIKTSMSTTYRHIIEDDFGQWALDHTFSEHVEDFEIEYEVINDTMEVKQRYLDFLNTHDIIYQKSLPKFIRSLQAHQQTLNELL